MDNWRIALIVQSKEPSPYKIEKVQDLGPEAAGYLAAYLLPFVTVTQPSGKDLVAYGLFMAVVALIYTRSDLIQVNPSLYIIGRVATRIRTHDGLWFVLISKSRPCSGDTVQAASLRESVLVADEGASSGHGQVEPQS